MTTGAGRTSREDVADMLQKMRWLINEKDGWRNSDSWNLETLATDYIALLDEVERYRAGNGLTLEALREWLEKQAKAYHDLFQRDGDAADMGYSEGQYRMAVKVMHIIDAGRLPE